MQYCTVACSGVSPSMAPYHTCYRSNLQCEDFEISQNTSPSMFHNVSASTALQKLIHTPQVQSHDRLLVEGSRVQGWSLCKLSPTQGPPPASRQQFSFRKSPKLATKKSKGSCVSPRKEFPLPDLELVVESVIRIFFESTPRAVTNNNSFYGTMEALKLLVSGHLMVG